MSNLTAERLREILSYDPESGQFTWVKPTSFRVKKGAFAGSVYGNGYRYIGIDGHSYKTSRLAWLYTHGKWPDHFIDHADGNPTNDRIANLRPCTHAENMQNVRKSPPRAAIHSRYVGVSWSKLAKRWTAEIMINFKRSRLGFFDNEEDAAEAYRRAKRTMHQFQPVIREGAEACGI